MSIKDDDLKNVAGGAGMGQMETYTAKKGDTLSGIAGHYQHQGWHGVTWERIYDWNRDRITNPNHIEVGWKLRIYLNK